MFYIHGVFATTFCNIGFSSETVLKRHAFTIHLKDMSYSAPFNPGIISCKSMRTTTSWRRSFSTGGLNVVCSSAAKTRPPLGTAAFRECVRGGRRLHVRRTLAVSKCGTSTPLSSSKTPLYLYTTLFSGRGPLYLQMFEDRHTLGFHLHF